MADLKLTEIFYSLQGESSTVGQPTVFIRLTGCPLRCQYCDTAYAFHGGKRWEIAAILTHIQQYQAKYVTVTGGEPLAQPACHGLLKALCDVGYRVSLETSGAISVLDVDPRVIKVMDLKTPGSAEEGRNLWSNIDCLTQQDEVKFVICDRADYDYACEVVAKHALCDRCEVLFSPSQGQCAPKDLAAWILQDRLPVRFQMQMHKVIWGDVPGH